MALSMAMIALGERPQLSGADIGRYLNRTWRDLPRVDAPESAENTIAFRVGDADVVLGLMPAPIPWSDLEGPCATSWLWPEAAKELRGHAEHVIVTVSSDAEPIERARLLTQVCAAICATCGQAVGVFWTDATLVMRCQMFIDFAVEILPHGPPVYIWVDFRVGKNKDGTSSGFTTGLSALSLMDFETLNSPEPPGELRERFRGLAAYVLENGPVIKDGDTVGEDANERIQVTYTRGSFGQESEVMRLDYRSTRQWWKFW